MFSAMMCNIDNSKVKGPVPTSLIALCAVTAQQKPDTNHCKEKKLKAVTEGSLLLF